MNGNKLLLDIGGQPLLRGVVEAVSTVDLAEVLVVVSPANEQLIVEALDLLDVRTVVNARASEGMGGSIALGAASVAPESRALLLVQGDQPLVDGEMLRQLVAAWQDESPAFVASRYDDLVTTPVLFDRALFADLQSLSGDTGARGLLERHRDRGKTIAFPPWRGSDVDTPEDYRRVRQLAGRAT